nr:MAG TPA: hypothetical protein [Caudoviricetes sp.]
MIHNYFQNGNSSKRRRKKYCNDIIKKEISNDFKRFFFYSISIIYMFLYINMCLVAHILNSVSNDFKRFQMIKDFKL